MLIPQSDDEIVAQMQEAIAARGLGVQTVQRMVFEADGVRRLALMFSVDPVLGMFVPGHGAESVVGTQCRWVTTDAPPGCWAFVHRSDAPPRRGLWEPIDASRAADRVAQYMAVAIYNTVRLEHSKKDKEAREIVGVLAKYLPEDGHGMVGYPRAPTVDEVIGRERWLALVERALGPDAREQVWRTWLAERNVRAEY